MQHAFTIDQGVLKANNYCTAVSQKCLLNNQNGPIRQDSNHHAASQAFNTESKLSQFNNNITQKTANDLSPPQTVEKL